jgi:hypothetical protein
MPSGEATNTNFIVFGLTRPGLEPMIYLTREEHAYHYAEITLAFEDDGPGYGNLSNSRGNKPCNLH